MKPTSDNTMTPAPAPKTPGTVTQCTRRIGSNRGKARLWIEGVVLSAQGWNKGVTYAPVWDRELRTLEYVRAIASVGVKLRKVAGDNLRPIIDTNTDDLLTTMGVSVGDTVSITITPERITVRPFDPAADTKPEAMKGLH